MHAFYRAQPQYQDTWICVGRNQNIYFSNIRRTTSGSYNQKNCAGYTYDSQESTPGSSSAYKKRSKANVKKNYTFPCRQSSRIVVTCILQDLERHNDTNGLSFQLYDFSSGTEASPTCIVVTTGHFTKDLCYPCWVRQRRQIIAFR